MARHNRDGSGSDQRGFEYCISYQPDWLRHAKVTRSLPNGRQSTMTLFRNPSTNQEEALGNRVRTRITCEEQGVDLEVTVRGAQEAVRRVCVTFSVPRASGKGTEEVTLTFEDGLPRDR